MAKLNFNKLNNVEQLNEGLMGSALGLLSKGVVKILTVSFLTPEYGKKKSDQFNKWMDEITSGKINRERLKILLAKEEEESKNLITQFLTRYMTLIGNLYVLESTPDDLSTIIYSPTGRGRATLNIGGKVYARFLLDKDIRAFEAFIDKYISNFEVAVRADYDKNWKFTPSLLESKLEEKIKTITGLSPNVKTFINDGGKFDISGTSVTIYKLIVDMMIGMVGTFRGLQRLKVELEKRNSEERTR
jgi:hypothetical protein